MTDCSDSVENFLKAYGVGTWDLYPEEEWEPEPTSRLRQFISKVP